VKRRISIEIHTDKTREDALYYFINIDVSETNDVFGIRRETFDHESSTTLELVLGRFSSGTRVLFVYYETIKRE
jgi:hypothetical protein